MKLAHPRAAALVVTFAFGAAVVGACLFSGSDGPAARHGGGETSPGVAMPKVAMKASTTKRDAKALATPDSAPVRARALSGGQGAGGAASSSEHGHATLPAARDATGADGPSASLPAAARRDLTPEQQEKLARALGKVDWEKTLKDLVAAVRAARANGQSPDPESFVEGSQVRLALSEAAAAIGLSGPKQALNDPTVRATVVPAWLSALGVDLDANQQATIARQCLELPSGNAGPDASALEARQVSLQSRIALEQSLGQVLTPQQLTTFAANVSSDPLMKNGSPQMNISASSPAKLSSVVASYWSTQFQLDGPSQETAKTVAQQYVAAVLAVPPVAPNLDAEAARLAALERNSQLVGLQVQAERQLAQSSSLTAAQVNRATAGSPSFLRLGIARN